MYKLTSALGSVIADRPSDVAQDAFGSAVHGAIHTGLCHTIVACADVP